ncbi:S-adenosyl-L-methionine-dependent methyltransferase [Lasiosphaeria hispida]|uniref:S-adenosyl-L-methionine-dependent methyltransferase n=1 Tax=Lasiosphaeria hispida TaxID=260671 RepID=A0AAJ0MF17_9PEZI|nr:S-adenosyl-L-methionine-dependent methyltransferase [Lasiosphaeria hispida]
MADDAKAAAAVSPAPEAAPAAAPRPTPVPAPIPTPAAAESEAVPKSEPAPAAPATAAAEVADILPASYWEQAPLHDVDEEVFDDGDSALGSTISSTASLSDSILEYRTIHGRTYHSDIGKAEAWHPNDPQQTESMDIHHHLCTLAQGGDLFLAPVPNDVQKVVDIGTGTGIWAIDFADKYPGAEVIGTDVSPIQPTWIPPNLKFEIDDANQEWTWPDNTFDYIHVRALFGSIADWDSFYREAFRCTKPGGWFEDYENSIKLDSIDGSVTKDSPMGQWTKVFWEGGKKLGRTFKVVEDDIQIKGMEAAGFVDLVVKEITIPFGSWPKNPRQKEIGLFSKLTMESDLEGYVLYMWAAVMGWSIEEIQVYISHLRRQIKDPKTHACYRSRVVYGRKPGK